LTRTGTKRAAAAAAKETENFIVGGGWVYHYSFCAVKNGMQNTREGGCEELGMMIDGASRCVNGTF
jgi:hypothetical protein